MNSSENEKRESVEIATPSLKDLIIRVASTYNRSFPEDIKMIEMGNLAVEAQKIRAQAGNNRGGAVIMVDHINKKLLLSQTVIGEGSPKNMYIDIQFDNLHLSSQRAKRQSKSVGLLIETFQKNEEIIPTIGELLIEEKDISSPAGVMGIANDGIHLFFRSLKTIEQKREENAEFIKPLINTPPTEFAKWNKLKHFYAPNGTTIATPINIFE